MSLAALLLVSLLSSGLTHYCHKITNAYKQKSPVVFKIARFKDLIGSIKDFKKDLGLGGVEDTSADVKEDRDCLQKAIAQAENTLCTVNEYAPHQLLFANLQQLVEIEKQCVYDGFILETIRYVKGAVKAKFLPSNTDRVLIERVCKKMGMDETQECFFFSSNAMRILTYTDSIPALTFVNTDYPNPVILINSDYWDSLPIPQKELLLAHELAHVIRKDCYNDIERQGTAHPVTVEERFLIEKEADLMAAKKMNDFQGAIELQEKYSTCRSIKMKDLAKYFYATHGIPMEFGDSSHPSRQERIDFLKKEWEKFNQLKAA